MLAGEIQDRDFEAQMQAFLLRYGGSVVTMIAAFSVSSRPARRAGG
jgi:hypothetical protein